MEETLRKYEVIDFWHDRIAEKKAITYVLINAEGVEEVLDSLENALGSEKNFRAIILPVEGAVPRKANEKEPEKKLSRISREELYSGIVKNLKLNWIYVILVIFSALVAAVGIVYGNIPMIVGAMIIAPLLGPNVALSLATTLGDFPLILKSLKVLFVGVVVALVFSALIGAIFPFDPNFQEVLMRTEVSWADPIISLISGSVGVLSYTTATLTSLAGVMIAVALLPPLVVSGMLFGAGEMSLAGGAFLLFTINLVGINLAGVTTFVVNKIRPRTFLEEWRAKRFTLFAFEIWIILFLIILAILFLL